MSPDWTSSRKLPTEAGKRWSPPVDVVAAAGLQGSEEVSKRQSLIISVQVKCQDGTVRTERALVDSGAQRNLVSQKLVLETGWPRTSPEARLESIDGQEIYVFGSHRIDVEATDQRNVTKSYEHDFSAVNLKGSAVSIVLGYPWLLTINPKLDFIQGSWRYRSLGNIEIMDAPEFEEEMTERKLAAGCFLYRPENGAFLVGNVKNLQEVAAESLLPQKYAEFEDVADDTAAAILPPHHPMEHPIDIEEGKRPPFSPVYNLSEPELEELRNYLDNATKSGRIRRSISPAGAPILFVPKKDGKLRLCVDYRGLNAVTIKNRTPLPLIGETLERLGRAKVFTKLDLKDAYHRIRIRKGDEWKTAFRTRYGHFEYLVMPFGLSNAPATFKAYINQALIGLVDVTCVVYLDDILIYSEKKEDHDNHVKEVLERLRQHRLYINLKKCDFDSPQVEFLGFIVSTGGVAMDAQRVQSVVDWPEPDSIRAIQVFLGLNCRTKQGMHFTC